MSSKLNIFNKINVLPSYGNNTALITWSISDPTFNDRNYDIIILKSKDGYTDWIELPREDDVTGYITMIADGYYYDTNFKSNNQSRNWYYQIILKDRRTNTCYKSKVVTHNHTLSNLEYGTVRQILQQDYLSPDNIPVFLLRPKTNTKSPLDLNKISSTINPLTGQIVGSETDEEGYGKVYKGGFDAPILTYLSIKTFKQQQIDLPTGHGSKDNTLVLFQTYAYPRFARGDLIIDPVTDNRYLVDNITAEPKFKGIIPLFITGEMTLLSRNSIEYKYQLPECAINKIINKRK